MGVLVGLGLSATSYVIVLGAVAKVVPAQHAAKAFGLTTAAGSFGMFAMIPGAQTLLSEFGWQGAMQWFAVLCTTMIAFALFMRTPKTQNHQNETAVAAHSLPQALKEAFAHRGYWLIHLGFFVCGFHVAFITVHFPAYISDLGLDASVGATALALIGLFNIAGSFGSGVIGQKWSKRSTLSSIYALRAGVIMFLLLSPPSPMTIYIFAGAMGLLWLSTVPLTTGIVAQVFGARYMATLYGIVFLSHQLGSFLGVWLGGYLYDNVGSYDGIWWAGVALGVAAAIIHLPINEKPLARLSASSSS